MSNCYDRDMAIENTRTVCECGLLRSLASDAAVPVSFDESLGQFQIEVQRATSRSCIALWYCPFCGGRLAEVDAINPFAMISDAEERRLTQLVAGTPHIHALIAKLGPPDRDFSAGLTVDTPSATSPSTYRVIEYTGLSPTATVTFIVLPNGDVRLGFRAKRRGRADGLSEGT